MIYQRHTEIAEYWPKGFNDIVYIIGEVKALELTRLFGGAFINVPKLSCNSQEKIWNALSLPLKETLHKNLAGDGFYVPKLNNMKYRVKTLAYRELRKKGIPVAQISYIMDEAVETYYKCMRNDVKK